MKSTTKQFWLTFVISFCATMIIGSAISSCISLNARSISAREALSTSYALIVQPALLVGIGAEQDAGRLAADKAELARTAVREVATLLQGGDPNSVSMLKAAWERLLPLALAGVDSRIAKGEIGPGVGAALKEAIRLFGTRLTQLEEGS